tara:strand:- start:371 stop:1060 length:690 start_codon:yes stop_codon:yes gene_type:complete
MKINTAIVLCAGYGKRLNPLTLKTPKPLLKLKDITVLETCINLIIKLKIKKIFLNTFHLSEQIFDFIEKKNFSLDIEVIEDGKEILDTGGGILNLMNYSSDDDYLIFNPDTIWDENYIKEINKMIDFYFINKLDNILLVSKKSLSFDKNFRGDFDLKNNLLLKNNNKNFIYLGCQILNKRLFNNYSISRFSISNIWDDLLEMDKLNGFESLNKFYHLTDLEIFKKLKDL